MGETQIRMGKRGESLFGKGTEEGVHGRKS